MTHDTPRRAALVAAALVGLLAASAATPATAGAQSLPGAAAKRAAQNAVAATNAHTAAMTAPTTTATTTTAAPAARAQSAAPGAATKAPAATSPAATPARAAAGKTVAGVPAAGATAAKAPASTPGAPAANAPAGNAGAAGARYAAGAGGGTTVSVSEAASATQLSFARETFEYAGRGRRDPFVSLMKNGDLRPVYSDLKLVTVLYDPTGRNSVAIMRDLSTKDQYRVKVGQTLGRMRVSQIQPKQVVFALDEFGYSRQEVLALNDSTKARKQ